MVGLGSCGEAATCGLGSSLPLDILSSTCGLASSWLVLLDFLCKKRSIDDSWLLLGILLTPFDCFSDPLLFAGVEDTTPPFNEVLDKLGFDESCIGPETVGLLAPPWSWLRCRLANRAYSGVLSESG